MASESTEEASLTVDLPPELADWLDDRARDLDLDRETVLVELLGSYRALDGEVDDETLPVADPTEIREVVADEVEARFEEGMKDTVEWVLAETFESRLSDMKDALQSEVETEMERSQEEYEEKIEDVRDRIVQVKREADEKAPEDHDHEEFERLTAIEDGLADLEERVDGIESDLDERVDEQADELGAVEERLDTVQDRLKTVAWIVRDLREAHESGSELEAVERIKRAAAKADVDRAKCERCGEGVSIGLLTDPECPHCEATVTNVEPADGFFSKPKLLVASQLEAGEEE